MREDEVDVKIYTDGSGVNNKIGASAIIYRDGRPGTALKHQLGSVHHTVYEGEAVGVLLALHITRGNRAIRSVNIYIDNRAAITAATGIKPHPGHYIFDAIHKTIDSITNERNHMHPKISWIPGHSKVEGNEKADALANEAPPRMALSQAASRNSSKPRFPFSKSAAKQNYLARIKKRVQRDWKDRGGTIE